MAELQDMAGGALILVGAFFYLVGAIGIYRMPDVFTRMHAAGISDTVGAGLLIVGMMVLAGFTLVSAKLAIILGVILFTSPIATHALAQATLHAGVEPLLADKRVLTGPGAHPGPCKAKRAVTKAKGTAVGRKPPVAKTARKAGPAGASRRTRS